MKIAQTVAEVVRQMRHHRLGYCPFCESYTLFLRVGLGLRENMHCLKCRSWSRKRHMAKMLCKVLSVNTLTGLSDTDAKIYNTDIGSYFDKFLLGNKNYVRSVYISNIPLGTKLEEGVFCQDLEQLTFPSNSFDVVITEDVLEHVRHYELAMKEIYRVLKPEGVHVFTVPIDLNQNMIVRVDASGEEDIYLLPKQYHIDGLTDGKILSYRTFGKDTPDLLKKFGFETQIVCSKPEDTYYGIYNSIVIVAKKVF
jgi:SAM-dependent methyltransferase